MANGDLSRPTHRSLNWVWDANTLTWVVMGQPILNVGNITANLTGTGLAKETTLAEIDANTAKVELIAISGSAASSGNNAVVTPASGKKLRISYLSYNPSAAIECAWRFGASGALFLRNAVPAAGIVAKDIGDMRYLEGAVDEILYLNLSGANATIWNCFYVEV